MDDMGIPLFSETSISTKLITQSASGSQTWRPVFPLEKTAVGGVREWVFLKMDGWISCRTNECRLLQWDPEIDEIEVGTLNLDIFFKVYFGLYKKMKHGAPIV